MIISFIISLSQHSSRTQETYIARGVTIDNIINIISMIISWYTLKTQLFMHVSTLITLTLCQWRRPTDAILWEYYQSGRHDDEEIRECTSRCTAVSTRCIVLQLLDEWWGNRTINLIDISMMKLWWHIQTSWNYWINTAQDIRQFVITLCELIAGSCHHSKYPLFRYQNTQTDHDLNSLPLL